MWGGWCVDVVCFVLLWRGEVSMQFVTDSKSQNTAFFATKIGTQMAFNYWTVTPINFKFKIKQQKIEYKP